MTLHNNNNNKKLLCISIKCATWKLIKYATTKKKQYLNITKLLSKIFKLLASH